MLYIKVPDYEKDEAMALGAKWDKERAQWYVEDKNEYDKFLRWMEIDEEIRRILCDYIYIIEASHSCFKCMRKTRVISFAAADYFTAYIGKKGYRKRKNYNNPRINFLTLRHKIKNKQLEAYLRQRFNFYYSYSKTINWTYCANHCQHCNIIQGDFFLHEEIDGPFNWVNPNYLHTYKFYKILLSEDGAGPFRFTGNGFNLEIDPPVEIIEDFKIIPTEI